MIFLPSLLNNSFHKVQMILKEFITFSWWEAFLSHQCYNKPSEKTLPTNHAFSFPMTSVLLYSKVCSKSEDIFNELWITDNLLMLFIGAVLFGIDPSVVVIRKSRLTYGLGVLNKFIESKTYVNLKI